MTFADTAETSANAPPIPWVPLIVPSHETRIKPNPEQTSAIAQMLDFLSNADNTDPFFVLDGPAGTGKTFCMREVAAAYRGSHGKLAFTAPTNKAAKVLRGVTGEASTIFSLLGLRISTNGEVKELDTSAMKNGKPIDLSDLDGVIIDEGGMTGRVLFDHLYEIAIKHRLRIVFMGDKFQLPPVKERESKIWMLPQGASLIQVMRHDNQILRLVTRIREAMGKNIMSIEIKSDHTEREGVWKLSKSDFKKRIYEAAIAGEFADTNRTKVIAWRNVKAGEYNQLIRSAIFGASAGIYEIGDRIIAAAPCMQGDEMILATDDEAIVESMAICSHPLEPQYGAIELKCRTEANKVIRLLVLHPASRLQFDNDCQTMAHAAKGNPKLWKKFWSKKELFHDIKYGYCITAHRAQGSTYHTVYADYQDILLNRERLEAFQCLYVACSRPTTQLFLA